MALNLEYLIPEKYRSSEILSTYLTVIDGVMEDWIDKIDGIADLLNPSTVPTDYIQYLADLLGAVLTSEDDATEDDRRTQLIQTVDWIKMKGTYQSIQVLGLMLNLKLEIMSMYTNDYTVFALKNWYVALNEGDNPADLDETYYNSPHFAIQIRLNVKYPATTVWVNDYLWIPAMFRNLNTYVEKTRPINTVPHYYVLMEPKTDVDGVVDTENGDIYTRVEGSWTVTKLYFDEEDSGDAWNFDEDPANYFDTSQDAFYNGITKWVLGTGSKGLTQDGSGFTGDIETPVLSGTVDDIRIYIDRVEWEIIVPAQVLNGISELALYTPGAPDILRLTSLFPDINLNTDTNLRIVVTVRRT